jgi:branched-chain amino acid transport system ATP-binding protein
VTEPATEQRRSTATNGRALLRLEGVDAAYGRVRALRGVTLEVDQGEVVALIGSNGAGKTTTLRTISGLMHPSAGTIMFGDRDLTRTDPDTIVKLGICQSPEGRRLFPRMTVRDNLDMGAYTRRDKAGIREDLDRVFELFPRLKERNTQIAGTLSGGEQQMLAIGRALMSRPKVLMLDEPSLGLAPILQDTIFKIVQEINSQGTPVLLVEQNAQRALQVAHRGYVLETGSIVKTGTGQELLQSEDVQKAYLGM